ncbi:DUF4334 domain-containing protein [Mycobacterium sherrisii]|uniref:DUF4334 domain-containing protein n=1 Tax=Mycobacterium sherrisii TaxID=243061 RepID=A0A1E3SIW7_9MYCO|nr:DUF4334 domain-containing protein [Mycobacterium sherrisii]MCV7029486.1 DUF4334 domain-containing protein [Mycobacterium sherrisii]MEC4761627.1 DUF4334 domain-containing protein [Mycobacterium sherrisii]ODR01603.1 hypothetical protein BHQ21_23335 [Mycobacterium sherrisii]ORW77673.1 hypothetical protein AWC25_08255 [Mycobacterium sherrisii]
MSLARKKFTDFKERSSPIDDVELDDFWASLEPATLDGMIGQWRGGGFATGHRMNDLLEKARWFGKNFNSERDVQPLVCLDADGNKFSNTEMGKGEASLWLEEFRGEVTATMVYDGQPVHDHFKKIDDDAVMGIMNGKGVRDKGRYFYFYLERV